MTMTSGIDSRYSWLRLVVSLLIATIGNVGMWAVVVILPAMQVDFGIDRAAASMPYTMTMIGFALGNYLIGQLADRFRMSLLLIFAALVNAAAFFLAAQSSNIGLVSVIHFVLGLGTAATFGPLIADISHWFLRYRGIAVALVASGNYLSGAIWPILLRGVLAESGWQWVYYFLATFTLMAMIPLALLLWRSVDTEMTQSAEAAASLRRQSQPFSPNMLALMLAVAGVACCVAMSMPQVHIVAYCVDLGFGPAVGAEMLSLMLLGGVVSRIISGLLADRIGGVRTLLIGGTLQCLALAFYLPFDGLVSLYVVSAVFGLSQGGIVPSYALIVREYLPARSAGSRVGLVMMATILGMALGGWMSGAIYDATGSYTLAIWNGIAWNLLNIAIVASLILRSRARAPSFSV